MPHFKLAIARLFRLPAKARRLGRRRTPAEVTPPADTPCEASNHLDQFPSPPIEPALQPLTNTGEEKVDEEEGGEDGDEDVGAVPTVDMDLAAEKDECVDADLVEVEEHEDTDENEDQDQDVDLVEVEEHEDTDENEDEDQDQDTNAAMDSSDVFPSALAHTTRLEMMIHRIYVALSDDDDEIAALRTQQCDRFTHIVRITLAPSSSNKVGPSTWTHELNVDNEPFEMRLKCSAFARKIGEHHTGLTRSQLIRACKFIAFSMPYEHDALAGREGTFPPVLEECEDPRLLIVGPADRSIDVMAVFVCYLALLTGASASQLPRTIGRLNLIHPQWKDYALRNITYDVMNLTW